MFQSIKGNRPKLNKFDLSHEKKLSCNMGYLIPTLLQEVVPGDQFRCSSEIMLRMSPMLAPVMHRVNVWTHYFFVPNRIVWDEWEDFITGGEDGLSAPVHPFFRSVDAYDQGVAFDGDLWDYLGCPTLTNNALSTNVNSLPFRGYHEIWNEYYRDQNLQTAISVPKTSGQESVFSHLALQLRCWEKDYLTSALPWAQRGDAISIPNVVTYKSQSDIYSNADVLRGNLIINSSGRLDASAPVLTEAGRVENIDDIGIDINDLRRSNALQKWLELAARGGSRYVEQVKAFFGVNSSDARLQRPEYLGGGRQRVMISEVLQTGESGTTPQGNLAGHGVAVGATNRFQRRFEEHGFVFGITSVLPRTAYQDGFHRMWSRDDKFDYYFPQFAHLGEQAIENKEVAFTGEAADDPNGTFGYQSRYAEYKYAPSMVHGDFRSSLDYWHMGRIFGGGAAPIALNSSFVRSNPTQRIFANTNPTDHKLWMQVYHDLQALRPMPYHADPRL